MTTQEILISTGEASGEMYAAQLATALRERADVHLFGLGSERLREAGVELIADRTEISMVGLTEIVRRWPTAFRINRKLGDAAKRRRPKLAILVDFPDFNLWLARRIKPMGVRIVYFISPQVWAWRRNRVNLIRRLVERVICIFPFEEKFYRDAGVPVDFVGHPLVDAVRPNLTRQQFAAQQDLDAARPIVALLPGSRESELRHNLPPMLEATELLRQSGVNQFVLALAPGVSLSEVSGPAGWEQRVRLVQNQTYDALATADAAIVSSGTATVEAALLGTPMVVVYRLSPTTAFVLRRMVHTPFISMVNLISGSRVVPELIQENFSPARVAEEVRRLLDSPAARDEMQRGLREVRERLGPSGAIDRAAGIIAAML
jgi:lipid-A-disaccharide synthase